MFGYVCLWVERLPDLVLLPAGLRNQGGRSDTDRRRRLIVLRCVWFKVDIFFIIKYDLRRTNLPRQWNYSVLIGKAGLIGVSRIVSSIILFGCNAHMISPDMIRKTFVCSRWPSQILYRGNISLKSTLFYITTISGERYLPKTPHDQRMQQLLVQSISRFLEPMRQECILQISL